MGTLHSQLNIIERARIGALLAEKASVREIGRKLKRSPNTISAELRKCEKGRYDAAAAQEYTDWLRTKAGASRRRLGEPHAAFLGRHLSETVTVRAVLGRLELERRRLEVPASAATCYRFIGRRPELRSLLPHRKRRAWGTKKLDARTRAFQECRHVSGRPAAARERTAVGHRELDLVCGPMAGSGTDLLVSSDRMSRHYAAVQLPHGKDADAVEEAVVAMHGSLALETAATDRGLEFSRWKAMEERTGAAFFAAKPHAPWEKPTVEWENGLARRFLPKGTDLGTVEAYRIALMVSEINHTPRQCLGWRTPEEVQSGVRVSYFK